MSGPVKDPLRALQGARSRAQGGRLISIHALREEGDTIEQPT